MKPSPLWRKLFGEPLVSRESLEQLVDSVADAQPSSAYLKGRWISMVMWWHTRSIRARWKYFALRATVVIGGVLLPVLTTLSAQNSGSRQDITLAIAVTGAIIAGCAAWEGVANYGDVWREKRRSAELLKVEGWLFLQHCGKYESDKTPEDALCHFISEVEAMIAREVGEYLGAFDSTVAQGRKAAESVMQAVADLAVERIRGK